MSRASDPRERKTIPWDMEESLQKGPNLNKESRGYKTDPNIEIQSDKIENPDLHPVMNLATKRLFNGYVEDAEIVDAYLSEQQVVQQTQMAAYKKWQKACKEYKLLEDRFRKKIKEIMTQTK